MLERLGIKNFKAWRDPGPIELAPITIFFGTNSSGKTSLHQSLLLLQQTAQSADRRRVLHLGDQHSTLDLGTFSDIIHDHGEGEPLEFDLHWRAVDPIRIADSRSAFEVTSDEIGFSAAIRQADDARLKVAEMKYSVGGSPSPLQIGMRANKGDKSHEYELTSPDYRPIRNQGRKWPLPAPTRFYGFPDEAVGYYQNTEFLADLNLQLETMLARIHYVGPLREYPRRLYLWSGEEPVHVGVKGEQAVAALLAGSPRTMNHRHGEKLQRLQLIVAGWLKRMRLIDSFDLRPIAKGRKEYEVILQTVGARAEVKLTDVGFGLSQVLPVIVECFYVGPNSTVVFEQPEIHLHPSVQADLADLFIEAIDTRESGQPRNTQFLVESHSEHLLRRLQRRIAEGAVAAERIAMYFCEPGESGATIRRLEIDEAGRIADWPKDFFGDIVGDVAAQTRSAIARMKAASHG